MKEEQRKAAASGREIWEKRARKFKLHINEDDLQKYIADFKADNLTEFYGKIHSGEINPDAVIQEIELRLKHPQQEGVPQEPTDDAGVFARFLTTARNITGGITLFGSNDAFLHSYAKCCNPIPGDDIVGYVSKGEGVKVHLRTCRTFAAMAETERQRVVEVGWPSASGGEYAAAIRIAGQDRTGLLNDITHSISSYQNTNIRGVKIDVKDSQFDGKIMINVKNTEHLQRIIEKLRKIRGVSHTERLVE